MLGVESWMSCHRFYSMSIYLDFKSNCIDESDDICQCSLAVQSPCLFAIFIDCICLQCSEVIDLRIARCQLIQYLDSWCTVST